MKNFSFYVLCFVLAVTLFNPVFNKYDYGAGFPMVLMFGVLLLPLAFYELRKKREWNLYEVMFLGIFCVFVILSFVFSQAKNFGFSEVLAYLSAVLLYLLYSNMKVGFVEKFLKVVMWFSVFAVLLGYIFYFTRGEVRMFGPFFNILEHSNVWPNAFALFLLLAWPLIVVVNKKIDLRFSVLCGFVLSGLLLTFSRGALIAFAGQILVLFIYYFKRIDLKKVIYVMLAGGIAIGLFFGANYVRSLKNDVIDVEKRLEFGTIDSSTSVTERADFWKGSLELIDEKALFGWGPFSFRSAYNPIQKTLLANADHPHNIFLKIGVENGLVALFGFLGFLATLFVIFVRRVFGKDKVKLSIVKKDIVFILFVSVIGGFAHNLIDYNFNFLQNLILLFLFMAFVRSMLIKKEKSPSKFYKFLLIGFAVILCAISLYEGSLLFIERTFNPSVLEYSLFPRNYFLASGDKALQEKDFQGAMILIDKEIALNPLDAQAYYLKGVLYCKIKNPDFNLEKCRENFRQAIEKNPMNDFIYYRDLIRTLDPKTISNRDEYIVHNAGSLIMQYFDMVDKNVHFTAYTQNVEAAAETVDWLMLYLRPPYDNVFKTLRDGMVEKAKKLREEKKY
ncbi:MAG: O-antigen ligase [Candidatus Roizmanbacteria bacterium]|nr:O-antigen ligase [Candidatus Roizmanbacteria bacterium]